MSVLDGISNRSRISLGVAIVIMVAFFGVETCIVFGVCEPSYALAGFGYGCIIAFMPPFFVVVREFLQNKERIKGDLDQKNIYLEHAAKIIRHDMHSGINTYLPRGIKSLKRRLTDKDIAGLKIGSPLKLIQDGLHHAQKVYSGVYEFTNLVKEGAQLNVEVKNVKEILYDYLKLTAYKNQVVLDDSLDTPLELNEALFCTAVDNFIRNGLKYNDSGTKYIKIYFQNNYNKALQLIIEDNGRGITAEEFIELSKPYVRKEGQKETGTGLGLNISISILKEHGYIVRAEKKESGGTKIIIEI